MDKDVLSYVVEKTHELIDSPTCNSETKASAEAWLAAVGTDGEAAATETY
ncbi:MAG: molecular chaperone Hsp90, partial [Clostridium sp.]|nr:molecular chaperone Hsp90 [Clostridium sp.]